jgi:hypothetical protein
MELTKRAPQIIRNPNVPFIFHSDFDIFHQLLNDLCRMASVHTSHGIMLQDFSCPADQEVEGDMPSIPVAYKSGIRSSMMKCHAQENVLGQFPASMRYCSTYILPNGIN